MYAVKTSSNSMVLGGLFLVEDRGREKNPRSVEIWRTTTTKSGWDAALLGKKAVARHC